jgi:hypothetical protein
MSVWIFFTDEEFINFYELAFLYAVILLKMFVFEKIILSD